jgi:hypothetical protein
MPLGDNGLPVWLQGALYMKCGAYEIQDSTRLDDVTNQNTAFFGTLLHLRTMLVLVIPSFNVCYKAI